MGSLFLAGVVLLAQSEPPPAPAALRDAEAAIRKFHKADYARTAPAAMQALAKKLLEEGAATAEGPAVRFAYFTEARDLAAQSGDVAVAFAAVDALAAAFQVDAFAMKSAALAAAGKVPRAPVAEGYAQLAEAAAAADDFDGAVALAGKAAALHANFQTRAKELAKLRDEFRPVKAALKTLETAPQDAAAGQTVGLYRCLVRDDWPRGLPLLAGATDPSLTALALREQNPPAEPALQVVLGDGWRDAAEKQTAALRPRFLLRALHWYGKASAGLAGPERQKVESRMDALVKALGGADPFRKGLVFWVDPAKDPADPFKDLAAGSRAGQKGVKAIDAGGRALQFSGTYVTYESPEAARIEKRGSVFFWIRSPSWDSLGYVVKRDDDAGNVDIGLYLNGGEFSAWLNWPENKTGYPMNAALPVNKWIFLGVAWDEKSVVFYLDGKESGVHPPAADGLPRKRTTRTAIGQSAQEEGSDPQIGLVGSVRIYDRALTPQEAAQLHLATRSKYRP